VGPERGNPNFGSLPDALGQGPAFVVAYAGATTGATLHWGGAAAAQLRTNGTVHAGGELWVDVQPTDALDNRQDYVVAAPDSFRVEVTVDSLVRVALPLVRRVDHTRVPASVSFRVAVPLEAAGAYVVDVYRAVDKEEDDEEWGEEAAERWEWESVAASVSFAVTAGAALAERVQLVGVALEAAAAGELSVAWMQLHDAYGNRVTDTRTTDNVTARLVPEAAVDTATDIAVALLHDEEVGARLLTFAATVAGRYILEVNVGGTAAALAVRVVAGAASAARCECEGDGVGSGGAALRAGQATQFTVRAVDAFGNALSRGGEAFYTSLASAVFVPPGEEEDLTAGADWVSLGAH
jgi:hypothetical protein